MAKLPDPRAPIRALRALARSRKGVAAVEFALVLPFMLLLYFGMAEVSRGVNADRKLTLLSRTLADLTGRAQSISNAEMTAIFEAASAVMHPFDGSQVSMRITSVIVRSTGTGDAVRGEVCWSDRRGTELPELRRSDVITPVPDGFRTPNTSYVLAEVVNPYTPTVGYVISGTLRLSETTPWPVRNTGEVRREGVSACL